MKYREWSAEWLENYVLTGVKDRTYRRYSEIVRIHLNPAFGEWELEKIRSQDVQKFLSEKLRNGNKKTGGPLSPNSVQLILSVLQESIRAASLIGLIPTYELKNIKRPKVKEKRVECFSREEQKRIEQAVLSDQRPKMIGILLCLYSGLRIGELMALLWTDIDFAKGELTVTKTCYDAIQPGKGFMRVSGTPKSTSSVRTVPIPRQILPYLKNAKRRNDSVFVVGDGEKILSIRSYQFNFESLLKKLKIKHRGFHALRHTFATRALECGMDVRTLAEILGHENPMITLKRYAHSMASYKKEMMNRVGKLL